MNELSIDRGEILQKATRVYHQAGTTYRLDNNPLAIICLVCGARSYNPDDISQQYCGQCKIFHCDVAGLAVAGKNVDINQIMSAVLSHADTSKRREFNTFLVLGVYTAIILLIGVLVGRLLHM